MAFAPVATPARFGLRLRPWLWRRFDQSLIGRTGLGSKAGGAVAEIAFFKCCCIDSECEKAFAQRGEGHEADTEFLEQWQNFGFEFTKP